LQTIKSFIFLIKIHYAIKNWGLFEYVGLKETSTVIHRDGCFLQKPKFMRIIIIIKSPL